MLGIELLLGNDAFAEEQFVALRIGLRVFALGLILGQRTLSLLQHYLKRARIDLGKHLALLHELTFLESHADELAVDAAVHGDGVECRDSSQAGEINGQIAVLRGGDHNGNAGHAAGTGTFPFSAAGSHRAPRNWRSAPQPENGSCGNTKYQPPGRPQSKARATNGFSRVPKLIPCFARVRREQPRGWQKWTPLILVGP